MKASFINSSCRFPPRHRHVDPTYPKELLPKSGLQVEPNTPLQPGETTTVKFVAADVAWEAERLTSLMRDPDSSFGGLLFFYDSDGERHIVYSGQPLQNLSGVDAVAGRTHHFLRQQRSAQSPSQ